MVLAEAVSLVEGALAPQQLPQRATRRSGPAELLLEVARVTRLIFKKCNASTGDKRRTKESSSARRRRLGLFYCIFVD
jgi:hypothetical protein